MSAAVQLASSTAFSNHHQQQHHTNNNNTSTRTTPSIMSPNTARTSPSHHHNAATAAATANASSSLTTSTTKLPAQNQKTAFASTAATRARLMMDDSLGDTRSTKNPSLHQKKHALRELQQSQTLALAGLKNVSLKHLVHSGSCDSCQIPYSSRRIKIKLTNCGHALCSACFLRNVTCSQCGAPFQLDSLDFEKDVPERAQRAIRDASERKEARALKRKENEREWRRRKKNIREKQKELRKDMKRQMRQRMLEIEEEKEQKLRELIEREKKKMEEAQHQRDQKRRLMQEERRKRERERKIKQQKEHFKKQEYEKISEQFLIRQREHIKELDLHRVTVALRISPLRENLRAQRAISQLSENLLQVKRVTPRHFDQGNRVIVDQFQFDHVWTSSYPLHGLIHKHIGKKVVTAALNGINSTVFTFGQSSTGKSFLMFGPYAPPGSKDVNTDEGLIPMVGLDLFKELEESYKDRWEMQVSFIEVYQERTRDLLSENEEYLANSVYETKSGQVQVKGVRRYKVRKYEDLKHLVNIGCVQRHTESTRLNPTSSRSHAVLSLFITYSPLERNPDYIVQTETNLVDLAGFERVGEGLKSTMFSGKQSKAPSPHGGPSLHRSQTPNTTADEYLFNEGVNINKSLLELGICLQKLAQFNNNIQVENPSDLDLDAVDTPQKFLSTRSSTLTWLLKNSLVGKSKVFMIGTVSPLSTYVNESLTTLFYASQAVSILTPTVSKKSSVKPQPVWVNVIRTLFEKIIQRYNRFCDLRGLYHHKDIKYKKTVKKLKKLVAKVVALIKYKVLDIGKEIVAEVLEKEFAHQAEINNRREFNTLLYVFALQFPKHYWEFIDHEKLNSIYREEDAEIYEQCLLNTSNFDEQELLSEEIQENETSAFDFRKHLM